jgi:hypothetical protein
MCAAVHEQGGQEISKHTHDENVARFQKLFIMAGAAVSKKGSTFPAAAGTLSCGFTQERSRLAGRKNGTAAARVVKA